MTEEELNAAIAEIIIPQEKPKSTGNSHRRKQWENKKYWHLCTKWKSCKVGKAKKCKLVGKEKNIAKFCSLCKDCFCFQFTVGYGGYMAGIDFDCYTGRFKKNSFNSKELRDYSNRKVRRYKGEFAEGGMYRKIFDYFWRCV